MTRPAHGTGARVPARDTGAGLLVLALVSVAPSAWRPAGRHASAGARPGADPTPSPAVATPQAQLAGALRARGLTLRATETAVRPGEPPTFAAVPRTAFQAILPDDPTGGLIVVYELPDSAAAATAAGDLAADVAVATVGTEVPIPRG